LLRIVAWDDPRCVQPLQAACERWRQKTGQDCTIIRRPLTAFNDQPLSELAPLCDVMIIDYPHVAQAREEGAITAICDLLPAESIKTVRDNAIGAAQESFVVDGRDLALASDAACQVAAYRPDRLAARGEHVPQNWEAVIALADRRPGSVAVPLYHTDAISCVLSLTAGAGAAPDGGTKLFPDAVAAREALETLIRLAGHVDRLCWDCTPQRLYAEAHRIDAIAYIPLTFGYTRLTRNDEGGWRFAAPPAGCGSLLGGAGMAVSAAADDRATAAAFAAWYCIPDSQLQAAFDGGQPAGRAAWIDADTDRINGCFFSDTRATQERAYVRPRAPWWPDVQKAAGEHLVAAMRAGAPASAIVADLEDIHGRIRAGYDRRVA